MTNCVWMILGLILSLQVCLKCETRIRSDKNEKKWFMHSSSKPSKPTGVGGGNNPGPLISLMA